jgi:diguanylate cyclase (GGDEF)-like protein
VLREKILKLLEDFAEEDEKVIMALSDLSSEHGDEVFRVTLHVLTHLEFSIEESLAHWKKIVERREAMASALNRNVHLQTALCDYFLTEKRAFKNPKVIEIQLFEETSHSSKYDGLTGLVNRRFLEEALGREIARAKRYGDSLSILFFDLDNFKKLNDVYGHLAGDAVLKKVAKIILDEKRTEDIAGRYGGEEMVLVLPATEKISALVLGERIRRKVSEAEVCYDEHVLGITLSGGLACCPVDTQDPIKLLEFSDKALYQAKAAGKNNIALYSQDKRRYLRIDFGESLNVEVLGSPESQQIVSKSKNLSMAGILFENEFSLEIGSKVQLSVVIGEAQSPFLLIGTVVRVENIENGLYDIGIAFLELHSKAQNTISKHITDYLERMSENLNV